MRIIVLDPHILFRDAFSYMLALRSHDVVARAGTVLELLELADEPSDATRLADVLVSEIELPDIPGTVALGKMRAAFPEVPIAILTGATDGRQLRAGLDAGGDGVILKTDSIDEVERVLLRLTAPMFGRRRQSDNPESIWSRQARAIDSRSYRSDSRQLPTLREMEVLELLVRGESTPRIAEGLGVRSATVRTHLQNLFIKFGAHSRLELMAFAVRNGLVEHQVHQRTSAGTWIDNGDG